MNTQQNDQVGSLKRHHAVLKLYRSRVRLVKEGEEYKGLCPLHSEHSPSFTVFHCDGTWLFKCFGCGAAGSIIDLVMKLDNVDFKAAIRRVEDFCNVARHESEACAEHVEEAVQPADAQENTAKKIVPLKKFRKYEDALADSEEAQAWLKSRGITRETWERMHLGFSQSAKTIEKDRDIADKGWIAFPYIRGDEVALIKYRSIERKAFSREPNMETVLYNLDTVDPFEPVYVVEGEPDAIIMEQAGFRAVALTSASTPVSAADLDKLTTAQAVYLAGDSDYAGKEAMTTVATRIKDRALVLKWPEGLKDANEVFLKGACANREKFVELVRKLSDLAREPWRNKFKTRSQLEQGPIEFYIENFLPEGVCFLGGLAGSGKTWVGLSVAKALCTGQPLFGRFNVPQKQPVVYLCPEVGAKALRSRLDVLGMPEDGFYCSVINSGIAGLGDPDLLMAIADLRPIVVCDTLVRFLDGKEENNATDIASLTESCFNLLRRGAKAVVAIHHSPKSSANTETPSLETCLRGSGDLGAAADVVHAVQCVDQESFVVKVTCVKARDFEPGHPFTIQGRPWLIKEGEFRMITGDARVDQLAELIEKNPKASCRKLAEACKVRRNRIPELAAKSGWFQREDETWHREPGSEASTANSADELF